MFFKLKKAVLPFFAIAFFHLISITESYASNTRVSSNEVYHQIDHALHLANTLLQANNIQNVDRDNAKEVNIEPMHVYELHVSTIREIYSLSLAQGVSPPPLISSSPIKYTNEDVYRLSKIIHESMKVIYKKNIDISTVSYTVITIPNNKTMSDIYAILYKLYLSVIKLRGADNVSSNQVYAQSMRIKKDVIHILTEMAHASEKTDKKRLLKSAINGIHPNGSMLNIEVAQKTSVDALSNMLNIRHKLNRLRQLYGLDVISIPPRLSDFKPLSLDDIFLQTQFVIAEINLLKRPLNISIPTRLATETTNKTLTDVYRQIIHIDYMVDRIIENGA